MSVNLIAYRPKRVAIEFGVMVFELARQEQEAPEKKRPEEIPKA